MQKYNVLCTTGFTSRLQNSAWKMSKHFMAWRDACVNVYGNYKHWAKNILKNSIFRDITLFRPLKLKHSSEITSTNCMVLYSKREIFVITAVRISNPKYILYCFLKCIQASSNKPPLHNSGRTLQKRCWKRITYNYIYVCIYSISVTVFIHYVTLVGNQIFL